MQYIIMTKGLPASGKSTWAKKHLLDFNNWKRINRDELRAMIDGGTWTPDNERFIIKTRNSLLKLALKQGYNVIIDDTNLKASNFDDVCKVAQSVGKRIIVQERCFEIEPNEAIARDSGRLGQVGAKVINDMYIRYVKNKHDIYKPRTETIIPQVTPHLQQDPKLPRAIICDLDGTLALLGDRSPYDASTAEHDEINTPVASVLYWALDYEIRIIFVSGREDKYLEPTLKFLNKAGFTPDINCQLYMRVSGDLRKDAIIKQEIFNKYIQDKYNIQFVLDDRNQVVEFWRSIGLPTFQVNDGDF